MTEEEKELYRIVADWWCNVFIKSESEDVCLSHLVKNIMAWKDNRTKNFGK